MRSLASIVATMAMLHGCSDPKAANESNFEATINRELAAQQACLILDALPHEVQTLAPERHGYLVLVEQGLVVEHEAEVEERSFFGRSSGRRKAMMYVPTEAGQRMMYRKPGFFGSGKTRLCPLSRQRVVEIENFTEPGDRNGHIVSVVDFSYTVESVPAWAKKAAGYFREEPKGWTAETRMNDRAVLVLTDKGWRHEAELQRHGRDPVRIPWAAEAAGQPKIVENGTRSANALEGRPDGAALAGSDLRGDAAAAQEVSAGGTALDAGLASGQRSAEPRHSGSRRVRKSTLLRATSVDGRQGATASDTFVPLSAEVEKQPDRYVTPTGRVVIAAPPP